MKSKFSKILGVVLPLAMILAMTITLVPARTPTVEAAALRFSNVAIPKIGDAGKYVITPDTEVGALAVMGSVMFADSINATPRSNLLKSSDNGATWTLQTGFTTAVNVAPADATPIVGIELSPDYDSDTTLVIATQTNVYQSIDGGITFSRMAATWPATENITDMDVALDERGRVAVIVGTTDAVGSGEVYVNSPATTASSFQPQLIGASYNVTAVAFSPYFSDDEGIFAVATNATGVVTTQIINAFGSTKTGGNWGSSFGPGRFRDRNGADIGAVGPVSARIAFPDDFNIDALASNIAFVGLSIGAADGLNDAGFERGDVYKVIFQPTLSSTLDLDVRGLIGTVQTTTNIYSIDVSGDAAAANIMVGTDFWTTGVTNYYWDLYYSTDSGATWSTPRESQPTGGDPNAVNTLGANANVNVLLAEDFATSQVAYAATFGLQTSGLSRTKDGGKSWRQISLVDWAAGTADYYVAELDLVSASEWYMCFEPVDNTFSSYWQTKNGGANYERFYSYANPTMPNRLDGLSITGANKDCFFIQNNAQGRFWRSTDKGASFPRIISAKGQRDANGNLLLGDRRAGSTIVNETTLYVIHRDGTVRYSDNLGRSWTEPDESIIGDTGATAFLATSGNLSLVSIANGIVYVSTDAGKNYLKTLGLTNKGAGWVSIDPGYATNKFVYHAQTGVAPNNGIFRTKVNEAAPDTTEWEQIDNTAPTVAVTAAAMDLELITTNTGGIFYAVAGNVTDGTDRGGLWRSTNPTADLRGVYPPHFEYVNIGLNAGDTTGRLGVATTPEPTFYLRNEGVVGTANYANQVVVFSDTLNKSADQLTPADKALNAGVSLNTEDLTMTAVLSWKAKTGATSYEVEVARDSKFESIYQRGYTTGQEVRVGGHITGSTYYWRVRVAADGPGAGYDPVGAPLISPYSAARSYVTGSAIAVAFKATSPAVGATDVPLQPSFVWTPFAGALEYEIMVCEDKDFAIIEWSHTVAETFFKPGETDKLAYGKTYYWRVRGVTGPVPAKGAAPGGPWATGIFTTETEPVEPTPTVIVQEKVSPPEVKVVEVPVIQQQPIPSYLLWTIIAVGAVLVIALIVLIVRTRRVT